MKNLFRLNLFFVGMPIIICLLGIFDPRFLIWGLLSTILTGLFQIVIGFGMLSDEPKNKNLQWYCRLVVAFFATWLISALFGYANEVMKYLLVLPPALALFLTAITYKKRNQ